MSTLYDDIVSQRGSLERLVARIPGFRGYQDKQARRQADSLLREYITAQIKLKMTEFGRIEKKILDSGGMAAVARPRDIKRQLQLLHDRIDAAMPGYSGMWAQMKVEAEDLDRLYSFDEAMMNYVDRIDKALTRLRDAVGSEQGHEGALDELEGVVTEALDAYALRNDVLTDLARR